MRGLAAPAEKLLALLKNPDTTSTPASLAKAVLVPSPAASPPQDAVCLQQYILLHQHLHRCDKASAPPPSRTAEARSAPLFISKFRFFFFFSPFFWFSVNQTPI